MIRDGRVQVNGQVATIGDGADPTQDMITVDGVPLKSSGRPNHLYILVNKPRGILCACQDDRDRPIILDLLPHSLRTRQGIHPVGRLDFNSTGALLLTNDGDFTYRLTHPRFHIPKRYRVQVLGRPSSDALRQWRRGVMLDDRRTLPAQVKITNARSPKTTELLITLTEGRNRQIRRTAEQLGHPVRSLHREAIGPLTLAEPSSSHPQAFTLKLGEHCILSNVEISSLKEQIGIISS